MRGAVVLLIAALLSGCGTTRMTPVDISGRWTGTWTGYGVFTIGRVGAVKLDVVQEGAVGSGWFMMDGGTASEAVPDSVRDAGITGVRVLFDVSGTQVRMMHELGRHLFEAELTALGDRMTGYALWTDPTIRLDLIREGAQLARAPVAVTPAPAPPPPAATTVPEPPPVIVPAPEPPRAEAAPTAPAEPGSQFRDAPPASEFRTVAEVKTIHFDFDRSEIRPSERPILDANAEWLRANPNRLVLIEGH